MRALQFTAYGGPEVLTWGDAPVPHAGPGQIRITVRAASVNPVDWKVLAGAMSGGQPLAGPGYLGRDAAGVVDEVGEGVAEVSVGDDVFGRGRQWRFSRLCWPGVWRRLAGRARRSVRARPRRAARRVQGLTPAHR